ncbi:MAG: tetratricopeptide repeat protein [bacterium]
MTIDDGIYREVDQELQDEKEIEDLKKNAPFLIAAAILIVVFVAGQQIWRVQKTARQERNSVAYEEAVKLAETDASAARLALENLAANAPDGYAALSLMQAASLADGLDDREGAIADYLAVTGLSVPERLKKLARIRAAYLSVPDGQEKVMQILNSAETEQSTLSAYAREVAGLAAMKNGDYGSAMSYFDGILVMPNAPAPLKIRVEEFAALASLGSNGVVLEESAETSSEMLTNLLDNALTDETLQSEQEPETDATNDN